MISNIDLIENLKLFEWLLHHINFYHANKGSPCQDSFKGQGRILIALSYEDGLKTKELASRIGIRTSSLNELLSKMEKNGFIKREPSKKDKRIIINSLTEKGRSITPKQLNVSVFNCLNEEERSDLFNILNKLNSNLEQSLVDTHNDKIINSFKERKAAYQRYIDVQEKNNHIEKEQY